MRVWQYIECALPFFNEAVWNARSDLAPSTPWIWRRSREICSIYICTRRKLNFCPFSDRFRDFTLWFTFMVHKKCVCLPALKTHKTTFLGGRTWNDTSFTKEILFLGGPENEDMGISPLRQTHKNCGGLSCILFQKTKQQFQTKVKDIYTCQMQSCRATALKHSHRGICFDREQVLKVFMKLFFFNFLGILNWKISVNAKEIFHPIYFSCGILIFFKRWAIHFSILNL